MKRKLFAELAEGFDALKVERAGRAVHPAGRSLSGHRQETGGGLIARKRATALLQRSPRNAARLQRAVRLLNAGKGRARKLVK